MSGCGAFTVFMNVIPALLQYHLHFSVSGLILLPHIPLSTRQRNVAHEALFDGLLVNTPFSFLLNISTVQDLRQPATVMTLLCCFFYRP